MRKPRLLRKGAKYHVVAKINKGENALISNDIKELFIEVIKRAKKKHKFAIYNFVIMNNHVHFIIQPLHQESLSKILQWILSVFAMHYNKIFKTFGHVWHGRFWSKIIDDIRQFIDTFDYISNNPVKAEMVKKAKDYKYGGLFHILNGIIDVIDIFELGQSFNNLF
jgi:REP element-mobilizing transposase RayT